MYIPQKFEYYIFIPPKSIITYLSFKIIQPHIFILQNPKPETRNPKPLPINMQVCMVLKDKYVILNFGGIYT